VTAVAARDVFCVYDGAGGTAVALQGLSLSVGEGEIVAVVGPSGSGKSTLLRTVAALERPSAGSVHVFGRSVATLSRSERVRFRARELGFVDQHYWRSLDPQLSARDLVGLQLGLNGVGRRTRHGRADELLSRVGLGDRRHARPHELSGGEQQRIAVCAAIAHRPRLVLADEPTGELDAESSQIVYGLLASLVHEERATALVVTHDRGVEAVADRVLRIRDGRLSSERAGRECVEEVVVGRGGWLQLPEPLLAAAGIRTRAHARPRPEGVLLMPAADEAASAVSPRVEAAAADPGEAVVTVRSLTKTLGAGARARTLFTGLDYEFAAGAVTAVTGPSGSGKTTLLRLLGGLSSPSHGAVSILGTDISALDRADRARFRRPNVAVVSQQLGLNPLLTARENIELSLSLRGIPVLDASREAEHLLIALGLGERMNHVAAKLSAGERQRVAIARALAHPRTIVLADEPTARLDESNALAVVDVLLAAAADRGAAIICATHDRLLADRSGAELSLGTAP